MTKTDTAAALAAAQRELDSLERELEGIDHRIKQSGLNGDDTGLLRAMARKIALPALIERAKRQLTPLALADVEARFAATEAERLRLYEVAEERKAALVAAQQALNEAHGALQDCDERRRELYKARGRAQRQVELFEKYPDGLPTSDERGVVVRSTWQQYAADRG